MGDVAQAKRLPDGEPAAHREYKKPKLSELPLDQAKRSAIDGLVHNFRKKGEFDNVRTTLRAQFESSVSTIETQVQYKRLIPYSQPRPNSYQLWKSSSSAKPTRHPHSI